VEEKQIYINEEDKIMKNKLVRSWIAMCLCGAMLAGCGNKPMESNPANGTEWESKTQTEGEKEECREPLKKVELEGSYERAAYLMDMVYEKNGVQNTMVSPLSLDMALGLVAGGANGRTKEEFTAYLGTDDYGEFAEQYMEYAKGLNTSNSFVQTGYNMAYEIANSIWLKDDRKLVESYAAMAEKQFDAEVEAVSFDKSDVPETVKRINGWCNEKTHELIPEIINENSISEDAVAVLINSLYFESPWDEEWGLTTHEFTDFEGTVKEQEMLRDTLSTYYENNEATAFGKRYSNGMQFIGILPKETGEFALSDLDVESLLESENRDYDVHAIMPKLTFDTTADNIVDILKSQGVETVFDKKQSDLTGLIEMNSDEVTYISDIIQKTRIELDENGTKAAAVTAVMMDMATCAMPQQKKEKEVYLDRPFAFMIYDEVNDQIVFVGKVVQL